VVWKAHDKILGRDVAVKEVSVPREVPDHERAGLNQRAMREARAAARLGHINSVTVFDVREEDRHPFIVMELIKGRTLQEIVRESGTLDPKVAAAVGLSLLDVLERAHTMGIVHRDVKPGNIMITEDRTVKLADFGIAAVKDDPRITQTGVVLGSPSYLAPEQARGETATPATDLWSLGAALYFAVEGEPPFDKGNAVATVDAVVHEDPRPPKRARGLASAIDRLLEKDPEARPTYNETRVLLKGVGSGRNEDRLSRAAPETATQALEPEPEPETPEPAREREPRSRILLWVGAALLALVAAGALLWSTLGEDDPAPQARGDAAASPRGGGGGGDDTAAGGGGAGDDTTAGAVPSGWTTHRDEEAGYTIAYPSGWEVVPDRAADSNTDFVDPETQAYMRVAWRTPPNPAGAEGAGENYEPSFADSHASEGYRLIGIEEYPYKGYDAALWEYTYGGYHAVNLGFVVDEYGFALNLQTPAELWPAYQDELETFKATFRPPD
jgi:eukaryotic-like serine/threonine-protein kinase